MKMKYYLLHLLFTAICFSATAQVSRSTESIGITDVIVIELAGNGDVWAGSSTQGVAFYKADIAQWSYYDSTNSALKSNAITSIALSTVAGVPHSYIGTLKGGVITQSGPWDTIANVSGVKVCGVAYRPDSLWVVTANNILRYDSSFVQAQSFPNTHAAITCVESGSAQCPGFWFGTLNSGCYFTSSGSVLTDSINTTVGGGQLVNNHVNALAVDVACNRVFVGTQGGFAACPTGAGPPCQNFTTANGLPQNDITAVVIGCEGNVWLGTRDSGVVVYNTQSSQFTRISNVTGKVTALACAENCVTYAATLDGTITQIDSNKTVIGVLSGIKTVQPDAFAVNVFPQPTGNMLNFVFEKEITTGELLLTDISGRTMQQTAVRNAGRITTDVSALPQGIYFYQLYSNKQLLKTGKVEVVR